MKKFEYITESVDMNNKWSSKRQAEELVKMNNRLNALGSDGWEMVAYESVPLTGTFSGNIKGYAYLLFFKREINKK